MSETVKFEIWAETQYAGSKDTTIIEVHRGDLEEVPENKWEDFVWKHFHGSEIALAMCDIGIRRMEYDEA